MKDSIDKIVNGLSQVNVGTRDIKENMQSLDESGVKYYKSLLEDYKERVSAIYEDQLNSVNKYLRRMDDPKTKTNFLFMANMLASTYSEGVSCEKINTLLETAFVMINGPLVITEKDPNKLQQEFYLKIANKVQDHKKPSYEELVDYIHSQELYNSIL